MVSVTRPQADAIANTSDPDAWLHGLTTGLSDSDKKRVKRAFYDAKELYQDAIYPLTGENLFAHAVAAAAIVADMELLTDAIAATLLFSAEHFRPNDCKSWITQRHNAVVADLVIGVGKMQQITELATTPDPDDDTPPEAQARQAETMRKMLLAMVADIRVVLIKLAWRTQTMHVLPRVADKKTQRRVAQETMDLFAPLANRLGVWQVKWELEDLAFRHLHPESYKKIARLLDERRSERIDYIERVIDQLRHEVSAIGIHAEIAGRPKHIYSIWKKMRQKNLDFNELYDIRAVRVLVENLRECYAVLGLVHHLWHPVAGEFDDYISNPKANDYKSLHTAVIGPEDKVVEIQIRTFDMHKHAEYGVAAHWRYKEGGGPSDEQYEAKIAWLRQLLEWREEVVDRSGLTGKFQTALFADTIYVLTPVGKVISLERGATPIDFAYALHTDLGHRCRGAKVDGQIVPLSTPLESGQRVEILTTREGGPPVDWLHDGWAKTPRARAKIRQWIRQQNIGAMLEIGRQMLDKALLQYETPPNLEKLPEQLGFNQLDDVLAALGHGELSSRALSQALTQLAPPKTPPKVKPSDFVRRSRSQFNSGGIMVEGENNLMTVLAKCCKPAPPDPIVGFITRGRGISIHRNQCKTLKKLSADAPERLITANWGQQEQSVFPIEIQITAHDRSGLLRDISDLFSREKINVTAVRTQTNERHATLHFTVEVRDVNDLGRILARLTDVAGIIESRRV